MKIHSNSSFQAAIVYLAGHCCMEMISLQVAMIELGVVIIMHIKLSPQKSQPSFIEYDF